MSEFNSAIKLVPGQTLLTLTEAEILEHTDRIARELMQRQGIRFEDSSLRVWNMRDNGARAALSFACWAVEQVTGVDPETLIPMTTEEGEG